MCVIQNELEVFVNVLPLVWGNASQNIRILFATHGMSCSLSDKKGCDLKGLAMLALPGPGLGKILLFLVSLAEIMIVLNR